jgi:hypothetical protein
MSIFISRIRKSVGSAFSNPYSTSGSSYLLHSFIGLVHSLHKLIIIMRFSTVALLSLVSGVFAGNCGPANGNAKCSTNECCKSTLFGEKKKTQY